MKRQSILLLTILVLALLPGTAWSGDKVPPFKQVLGAACLAKAELALLKGQLNRGKVYLAAAHEADPGISVLRLKAFDMMYKDFPYLNNMIPGYRGGPAAFSMDGRFVAYSTRDSVSRLDLETGELKSVGRPEIGVHRIEVSPKGRFVAVCDNKGNLALCDMKRETKVGQFTFRKEEPSGLTSIRMSFSQDENSIAAYYSYGEKKALYFLRTMDLSVKNTLPITLKRGSPPHLGPIRFLSDGSLLVGMGGRTELVDPSTMRLIKTLAPTIGWDVDYLPDKDLLVIGGRRRIEVFNSATQEKVAEYQAASHNIVLVRFLGDGRYIAYASPKGESGIIDCTSGKPLQVFNIGRDAAVSPSRYLLLARGKVIDLSVCRPYEANLSAEMPHATRPSGSTIPDGVRKALADTSEKALRRSGRSIELALKGKSGNLEAYGTGDGRTFIYDHGKAQVTLLVSDVYRSPIDFAFFPDDSLFVRLCYGAVEAYSLPDGSRTTLRFDDPPVSIAIAPDLRLVVILDWKNRVFLSVLPSFDTTVELLPATQTKRLIFVDRKTKTLVVKTDGDIGAYDLRKVAEDRVLPTYAEASSRYSVSLDELEPQFDLPTRVELRKAEPVTPKTTRFDVPEDNLKIPEEMQTCTANLKKIYTAIRKYEKDKGKLPDWLSDLVPDYLSSETLFCPKDARYKSPYSPDPKLPCSYGWELSSARIPSDWDPTRRTLYRDWKTQQIRLFGDVVPMVRCHHHGSNRVLNLSAGGEIWWGSLDWEYMFMPDYDSIHKQMLSRAIASRPAVPAPSRSASKQSSSLVGKLALSFTLKNLEGKQVSLSDFKGKVVLLDFWATWCGPCIRAIPHLEALHRKYKDQGLVVIGINHERDHDKVKAFSKEQISYVVLLDADEQFKEYGIRGIPTAFYINREGEIRHCEIGFGPGKEKEMEQKIKELLAGKEGIAVVSKSLILQEVSGTKFLRGTWGWDIDSDSDGQRESDDIWWEHVNERERYLVPRNGAGLAMVRDKAFDDLLFSDLNKMEFSRKRISASDAKPDIDVGTVLAVRTTEGNLAKLEVTGFDPLRNRTSKYHMRLRYTLYEKSRQRIEDLSEKQAAQAGDGKVNNGRLPIRIPLEHTTEMRRWGITYYRPQIIELSTNEPLQSWVLPQFFSATQRRFWARKMFGGKTIMNVVIHTPLDPKLGEWDVFITFGEDVDFSSTMPNKIGVRSKKMMEFNIDYRNGAKQPYVIRIGPNARNPGHYFLTYNRECIRTGTADVLGRKHKIALSDDDADGLYSDLADTMVIIDHDADGHMSRSDRIRADSPIGIGLSEYFTIEINDDGSSALLRPAEYGILEGFVTRESSKTPVPKARVKITPHGFEALTGPEGRYEMRLPVGRYSEVQISARGYVPVHIDRVPLVSDTTTANLSVHLRIPKMPQSGEITLHDSDSYHFLSGQRGRCTGGDFYFSCTKDNPRFLANNRHQGGLVDLGQSKTPLDAVTPPMRGYSRFGVLAEVGHVYVSLAKQGEDDCHIVFRVTEIKQGDSCTLQYYYRQGETIQ